MTPAITSTTNTFLTSPLTQIHQYRRHFEDRLHRTCDAYIKSLFDFTLGPELTDYPACHDKMQTLINNGTAAIKATLDEVAIYLLRLDRRNLPDHQQQQQSGSQVNCQPFHEASDNLQGRQQPLASSLFSPSMPSSSSFEFFGTPSSSFILPPPATLPKESSAVEMMATTSIKNSSPPGKFNVKHSPNKSLDNNIFKPKSPSLPPPNDKKFLQSSNGLIDGGKESSKGIVNGKGNHNKFSLACPIRVSCPPIVSRTKMRKHLHLDHGINNFEASAILRKIFKSREHHPKGSSKPFSSLFPSAAAANDTDSR